MSYILRNITRGDLSLTNTIHIKHNGYAEVDEITETMRDEERRGIIRISSSEVEKIIEPVEIPIPSIEVEVPEQIEKINMYMGEDTPIINTIEESEPITQVEETMEEKTEVANNSSKSFNYNQSNPQKVKLNTTHRGR